MCSGFSMSYKKQGKCLTRLGAIAKVASRRRAGPLWERAFRAITVNSDSQLNSRNFDFLAGGGEMGERMRALDWTKDAARCRPRNGHNRSKRSCASCSTRVMRCGCFGVPNSPFSATTPIYPPLV